MEKPFRISFDIGGVLSKYPQVFRPMVAALVKGGAEVYVITDMRDHAQSVKFVRENGYDIPPERILNSNYEEHSERCKERTIEENKIDVHIDDFPGYCAHSKCVSLFVWPNPELPYYHDDFVTDGSEGSFGRSKKPAVQAERQVGPWAPVQDSFTGETLYESRPPDVAPESPSEEG